MQFEYSLTIRRPAEPAELEEIFSKAFDNAALALCIAPRIFVEICPKRRALRMQLVSTSLLRIGGGTAM